MEITHGEDRSQGLPNFHGTIFLFKSERLNADIKLTLLKTLIKSLMTYACSPGSYGRIPPTVIAAPAKPGCTQHWKFSKAHICPRFECGFPKSLLIGLCCEIMHATGRINSKS
jgi:hypothetical protein